MGVAVCGSCIVWDLQCAGIAAHGSGWELQCVGLLCVRVAVWGSHGLGKLQFGEIAMRVSCLARE